MSHKNPIRIFIGIFLTFLFIGSSSLMAAPAPKVDICHSGGTFNPITNSEEPLNFVINISENAVPAHINHGDCPGLFVELGEGQECELQDDGVTVECETVTLCECVEEPEEL